MKTFIYVFNLFIVMCMNASTSNAQGIFNQKGAWIKNQIKQIALWEVYIRDLKKGYAIAKDGLNTIGDIKNGDFHLHQDYFNSLVHVNPAIKKYSKAVEIILLNSAIKRICTKGNDAYVNAVFAHLTAECDAATDQLNMILSPGSYKMTDDERISGINKLCLTVRDQYDFARNFTNRLKILSVQKLKAQREVQSSLLLNNLQP